MGGAVALALVLTPAPAQTVNRWYSFIEENSAGTYQGFYQEFQDKSLGGLGSGAGVEISCGNNGIGEPNLAFHNMWAVYQLGLTWIETYTLYVCPLGGPYSRAYGYQFWRDGNQIVEVDHAFTDVDVQHNYKILHQHNTSLTCGSLPDDKSWFVFRDGVKIGCAGFHDLPLAPHFSLGQFGLEISNGTYGLIKSRHLSMGNMQSYNGVSWASILYDAGRIDYPPDGGHSGSPYNWFHTCSGLSSTCH